MKFLDVKTGLVLLSLLSAGCSMNPKASDAVRQPQSSAYEEVEVISNDIDVDDAYEFEDDGGKDIATKATILDKVCKAPEESALRVKNRVVTLLNGQHISGSIRESFQDGKVFVVATDYGVNQVSCRPYQLKRNAQELAKALVCQGTKSKKLYGIFKVDNRVFTGHVREVYTNGVIRFVNDSFQEQFSSTDKANLEIIRSKYNGKKVLFMQGGKEVTGQIRRSFEGGLLLVKYQNRLFAREASSLLIQD